MRKCAFLLLTALLSLAFAPAPLPQPDSGKDDLKKMQGTWEMISLSYEGRPVPMGSYTPRVVIADGWLNYTDEKGSPFGKWALTLDARKAPRAFDMRTEGENVLGGQGIYELRGDTLIRCLTINQKLARPTDFNASKPGHYLQVLKRVKR